MTHERMDETDQAHHLTRRAGADAASDRAAAPGAGIGNRAFARLIQRAASQGAGPLDPAIGEEIEAARPGGRSLDSQPRADMEGALGVDLAPVRIHTGPRADAIARSVQADAITTYPDVFFREGKYAPGSSDGRELLAHELTHIVQQGSGLVGATGEVSHPDDPHEQEARAVAEAVVGTDPSPAGGDQPSSPGGGEPSGSSSLLVARQEGPEELGEPEELEQE
jgi:hypothetical protein